MLSSVDLDLLQRHTVEIYSLDKKDGILETVNARSLLSPKRFDLFAKLFYLNHKDTEPEWARKVYLDHIKAFNPEGKEPGREDKSCLSDFLKSFDVLIDHIRSHGFDQTLSLVPVGNDNVILDGAHRVAILAFLNLPVGICRFDQVPTKGPFDYRYFISRGLSQKTADQIALEATTWFPDVRIACLWPRLGNARKKDVAVQMLRDRFPVLYERDFTVSRKALTLLVLHIYRNQDWLGGPESGYSGAQDKAFRCFAKNRKIRFVFFIGGLSQQESSTKEAIRETTPYGKHSIHITDTRQEAQDLASMILDEKGRRDWLYFNKTASLSGRIRERVGESLTYFRNIVWLDFKVQLARILHLTHP